MTPYDPRALEQFYRFMAEASRSQAEAQRALAALAEVASPEAWARAFGALVPGPPSPTSAPHPSSGDAQSWAEGYWAAFGFVPKARYDALEAQYLALKAQLEGLERTARGPQEAESAQHAWSAGVKEVLAAQEAWWGAWLGQAPKKPEEPG